MKYALQLYSVRDGIKNGADLLSALGKVRQIGYEGVEFAGVQKLPAETLRERLDELGLTCVGAHISLDDFKPRHLEKTLAYYRTLGCQQVGVGGADIFEEKKLVKALEILENANREAEKWGMKVYFHNHTHEFAPPAKSDNPAWVIDRLKQACYLQVDTYWSFYAGVDTPALLRENRDRICLVHLKDGNDGTPCAIGEGQNDIAAILKASEEIGMEWVIIENDDPVPNGLSDVARSLQYLKNHF